MGLNYKVVLCICILQKKTSNKIAWKASNKIHWNVSRVPAFTLPESNIVPKNRPLEKEIPIGNYHFQGLC